jgi:hypothetical protein
MKEHKKQKPSSPGTAPKSNALHDGTAVLVTAARDGSAAMIDSTGLYMGEQRRAKDSNKSVPERDDTRRDDDDDEQ